MVGLYLNPPADVIVLCVDEKSQIQALNRTQKVFVMQPGHNEQRSHGYVCHGTTILFAVLEIAAGKAWCQVVEATSRRSYASRGVSHPRAALGRSLSSSAMALR